MPFRGCSNIHREGRETLTLFHATISEWVEPLPLAACMEGVVKHANDVLC